jgi:hypothetical protein
VHWMEVSVLQGSVAVGLVVAGKGYPSVQVRRLVHNGHIKHKNIKHFLVVRV